MLQDYENELFVYKYRPKTLKEINRPVVNTLNKIIEKNTIPNLIFYGQKGSGKKSLFYAFLRDRYGDFKTQCFYREYKINTKKIEIPIFHSPYHVEIDVRSFLTHVRTILPILIKEFSQTKNVLSNQHKLFVIHHIEELEMQTQHTLRRILEIYIDNCRFIFICSTLNKITHPLQSRCLILRIPQFTNQEITKIITDINNRLIEDESLKKLNTEQLNNIVNTCDNNIKTAIFNLESTYYNFETDISYEKELIEILNKIINAKKVSMSLYETIDNYLYMNLYKNRCLQDLIHTTFINLRKLLNNDYSTLNQVLPKFIEYDQHMVQGSRDFIHIQALFYYLVYFFHNKSE